MGKKKKKKYQEFLVPTIISTAISILGFLIYNYYFLPSNIKEEIKREMYVQLLSETSVAYDEVIANNNSILSSFSVYGLQSNDLDSIMEKYHGSIKKVESLNSKLRSMGNEEQINFNKNFLEELWFPLQLISIHKTDVQSFERLTRQSNILIEQKKRDSVLFNKTLNELDSIVKKENKLFFELRDYYFPRLDGLARLNNYFYRTELGLTITTDILEAQKDLKELDSIRKEFNYFTHQFEYTTARARHLIDYKVDAGDSLVNQFLMLEVLSKFLTENDKNSSR